MWTQVEVSETLTTSLKSTYTVLAVGDWSPISGADQTPSDVLQVHLSLPTDNKVGGQRTHKGPDRVWISFRRSTGVGGNFGSLSDGLGRWGSKLSFHWQNFGDETTLNDTTWSTDCVRTQRKLYSRQESGSQVQGLVMWFHGDQSGYFTLVDLLG